MPCETRGEVVGRRVILEGLLAIGLLVACAGNGGSSAAAGGSPGNSGGQGSGGTGGGGGATGGAGGAAPGSGGGVGTGPCAAATAPPIASVGQKELVYRPAGSAHVSELTLAKGSLYFTESGKIMRLRLGQ